MKKGCCSFGMFLGRILISLMFLWSGVGVLLHWGDAVQLVAASGLPMPELITGVACAVELIGGLSLILGYKTRFGALLLFLLLVPATFFLHDFWTAEGAEAHLQKMLFFKNLAVMGGLLFVMCYGGGSIGCDKCCGSSCSSK